jgi:hypothetical protein
LAKDLRWEKADRDGLPEAVIAATESIEQRQSYRRGQIIHHLRLYGDRALQGYVGTNSAGTSTGRRTLGQSYSQHGMRLSLNIVRNMVDAATSRLSKGRPRPQNLTTAADYSAKKIARQRDKFLEGHFRAGKFWALRQRCIKNAALLGTGCAYVMEHWGQVRYEYVFPGELLIDDAEGVYGEPRNLFRQRCFDRQVLIEKYPRARQALENAAPADNRYFGRDTQADQVVVTQAWNLPAGPDKKGRSVCVIDGGTLYDLKWEREKFPFTFWRWSEDPLGFWGVGLAEQLSGLQLEINQLLRMIQNNMYLGANIKVMLERGSKIVDAQISNTLRGALIEYSGTKPDFHVHDVITEQVLRHLQSLKDYAYEISGISQLSAAGALPAGLAESGRAQLVYHNIESERFLTVSRNDEQAVVDAAELTLECGRDILERDGTYKVVYRDKNWIQEVDAKQALQDVGIFEVAVVPASQLPHDFAGRMAVAEKMEEKGWLNQTQAKQLLADDLGDIESETELDLSPSRLVDMAIEQILEEQEYVSPDPHMDLMMAIERGTKAFLLARLRKYPTEAIDMLNTWIEQCQDLLNASQLPAPGAMPAPDVVPPPTDMAAAPIPPGAALPPTGALN